jgi:cytochrome P450
MEPQIPAKPLPVVKGHWLLKNGLEIKAGMIQFVERRTPEYGDIFFVDTLKEQMVVINHPDYAKYVFQENNKNYTKSFAYEVLKLFLGNGLLTSEGDFWLKQRRLAQPAFHRERLQKLSQEIINATEKFVEKLYNYAKTGEEFNLSHHLNALALEIVSRALFTTDVANNMDSIRNAMDIANEFAIARVFELFSLPMWVPTKQNLDFKKAHSELDTIIRRIIESRRKSNELHHDLLAMLMETKDEETGEKMSDQQLRDEVITIFLAGHETTAVALSWFFNAMFTNREIEQKIRKEAQEVCQGNNLLVKDISNLKFTRMAIDESLRLFPPAWIIGRKNIEDDIIGGFHIPKNTNVIVLPFQIHRLKEFWDNPEEFIPERFTPEKTKEMHKFAYFPFGGGPRQCIGNNFALMEMQVIVATILKNFTFERPSKEEPEMEQLVTLRMKNGLRVKVKKVAE